MNLKNLRKKAKNKKIIGVIGHRDLTKYDCHYEKDNEKITIQGHLRSIIEEKLNELKDEGECILLSHLAEGADQLVADVALEMGLEVVVITPWEKENYGNSLKNDDKKVFFSEFIKNKDKDQKKDEDLVSVYELDKRKPENEPVLIQKLSFRILVFLINWKLP